MAHSRVQDICGGPSYSTFSQTEFSQILPIEGEGGWVNTWQSVLCGRENPLIMFPETAGVSFQNIYIYMQLSIRFVVNRAKTVLDYRRDTQLPQLFVFSLPTVFTESCNRSAAVQLRYMSPRCVAC